MRTHPPPKDEIFMRDMSPEEEEYLKEVNINAYNVYMRLKNEKKEKESDEGYVEFTEPPETQSV